MKSQELLHAIQHADRQYYAEAEQRIYHRREHTMKHTVMLKVLSGTAAAAMLGVAVFYGAKYLNSQPIVTTVPGSAASQAMEQTERAAAENFLGGHGALHYSANADFMYDSDNWYFTPYLSAALNADAANVPLQKTAHYGESDLLGKDELFIADSFGSGMFAYDTETGVISSIAADGTKTPLNTAEYREWQETGKARERRTGISVLAKLTDTKYFVEGYYFTREGMHAQSFWQIFDTATGTAVSGDQDMIGYDRVFSDGNAGVYGVMWNRDDGVEQYQVAHITEEGIEFVLSDYARSCGWYVYGNCIYYRLPEDDAQSDRVLNLYCYNMDTKETTVALENCGFDTMIFCGDRVYAQIGTEEDEHAILIATFNPDLTDRRDITIDIADFTQDTFGYTYLKDVCGDSLSFEAPARPDHASADLEPIGSPVTEVYDPGFIVYHMSDGTVQCYRGE